VGKQSTLTMEAATIQKAMEALTRAAQTLIIEMGITEIIKLRILTVGIDEDEKSSIA